MRSGWAVAAAMLLAVTSLGAAPAARPVSRSPEQATRTRPDIVFVMTDDMRPDEMEAVATLRPQGGFAWMRDHATRTRLWYGDNLCCPSRTTMLTGQTAFHHGVLSNTHFPELGRHTLPVWLRESGYCTGFSGRYLNHYAPTAPRPPGWDFWEPLAGRISDETGYAMVGRDGKARTPGTFITDEIASVSRAQLRDCLDAKKPAFLAVWPFAPHFGSDPAPQYAAVPVPWTNPDPSFNEPDISDKPAWLQQEYPSPLPAARFAAFFQKRVRTLLSVDDLVMKLVEDLRARHRLDRTVFLFTGDNGWFLGEHRIDNRKEFAYEAGQGALWIAGPKFSPRDEGNAFVQNTDITRTILDAAHASGRVDVDRLDGVSIQQLLRAPDRGHDRFLPLYVPVEGLKYWSRPTGEGVRTWRYKYVRYVDGSEELYDLAVDPSELTNVAGDPAYADRRVELRALARQAKRCRGDACRRPAPRDLQS